MSLLGWAFAYGLARHPVPVSLHNAFYTSHYTLATLWGLYLWNALPWGLSNCPVHSVQTDFIEFPSFRHYYLAQLAFYGTSLFYLIVGERSKGDEKEYGMLAVHHLITIALITISMAFYQMHLVGFAVMLLHDFSDVFLFASKGLHERGIEPWNYAAFAVFAVSFFALRIIAFPLCVIFPCIFKAPDHGLGGMICIGCLIGLQLMHWKWWIRIWTILSKTLRGQDIKDEH